MDKPASLELEVEVEVEVKLEDVQMAQGGRDTSVQIILNSYGIAAIPSPSLYDEPVFK